MTTYDNLPCELALQFINGNKEFVADTLSVEPFGRAVYLSAATYAELISRGYTEESSAFLFFLAERV